MKYIKMKYLLYFLFPLVMFLACKTPMEKTFHENGQTKELITLDSKGYKNGLYKSFLEDGSLFEEATYKNGLLEGLRKIYYPNGQIEIEENYKDDRLHGRYAVFSKDGNITLESNYTKGVLKGLLKRFYENGSLMEEVTFENNEENGPFKEYYSNGNVQWSGSYLNGDSEFGLLEQFNEEGSLIKKMRCDSMGVCQTIWTPEEGDIVPEKIKLGRS